VSKATEESEEARPDDGRRLSTRGVIKTVTGHGTARGIPELHQVAMEMEDGTFFEAGMPTPEGVEATGRLLPLNVDYVDFGECPICLEPNPSSREHVPPHSCQRSSKVSPFSLVENLATLLLRLFCRVLCVGQAGRVDAGVFQPVGGAFEGDDFGVVNDAVDHRGGDDLVAEDVAPACEWQVAGED
jgi:hypothetical protein